MELRGAGLRWFPLVPADFRWFPESLEVQISLVLQWFLHLEPSKNGSDPDLARSGLFEIRLPTAAGSTFSIFNTFHVDANAFNSFLDRYMGLSKFALSLGTCAQLSSKARTAHTHRCIISTFLQSHRFQNHAPHSSGKHIFDFQPFPCRCKCKMFVSWSLHGPLGSCFDRDMCLSEFALSLVTCAQLSSKSQSANSERPM